MRIVLLRLARSGRCGCTTREDAGSGAWGEARPRNGYQHSGLSVWRRFKKTWQPFPYTWRAGKKEVHAFCIFSLLRAEWELLTLSYRKKTVTQRSYNAFHILTDALASSTRHWARRIGSRSAWLECHGQLSYTGWKFRWGDLTLWII